MREKFWYMGPWVVRPPYFRNDHFKISVANVLRDHSFSCTQNFQKNLHFLSLDHIEKGRRKCSYQGVRNVSFSENLAYVLNE